MCAGTDGKLSNAELIQVWEKAVDTQMHFNEMSVKSRQLGLTFATAALGVAVVLFSNGSDFYISIGKFHAHISGIIMLAAAAAIAGVSTLDLKVYHKMLRGAVAFGEDLENNHLKAKLGLDKGMTQAISHFSRHPNATAKPATESSKCEYLTGEGEINAGNKIKNFYIFVIASLVIVGGLTLWAGHVGYEPRPKDISSLKGAVQQIDNASTEIKLVPDGDRTEKSEGIENENN